MKPTIKPESLDTPVVAALIGALNAELDQRYPEAGANHFRLDPDEVAPGRGVFLVAYAGGEAVGCGAARLNEPGTAEIKRMYVVPTHRGRGIAGYLLAALEDHAKGLGARQLVLETGERQPESLAVYRRAGFEEIPRFGEYVDSPLSTCMGKALEPWNPWPSASTQDDILKFDPPVARLLGREIVEVDTVNGGATIRFTAKPEFSNRHGTVQGGLLAAMLDSATALALYTVLPPEFTGVTMNLNVSFVRPAKLGAFTAIGKLLSRDHRYGETSAELHDAEGVVVATAVAKLRIVPRKDRK